MEVKNFNAAREPLPGELLIAPAVPVSTEREELLTLLCSERVVLVHVGQPLSEA